MGITLLLNAGIKVIGMRSRQIDFFQIAEGGSRDLGTRVVIAPLHPDESQNLSSYFRGYCKGLSSFISSWYVLHRWDILVVKDGLYTLVCVKQRWK